MPYAKSWTEQYNDEWFLSLTLSERGMWHQLRDWAKLHGDTGGIFLGNMTHAGIVFGCDRKTAGRILGKFHSDARIVLSVTKSGVNITIVKYEYWQRVKTIRPDLIMGEPPVKSPISRADKTRAKKSKAPRMDIPFVDILNHLNEVTGKEYKTDPPSKQSIKFITDCWNRGYRLDDFKHVHVVKFEDKKRGEFAEKYLRPETLYGNKFEGYRQQSRRPKSADKLSLSGGHAAPGAIKGKK